MDNIHLISKYAICYSIFLLLTYVSKLNGANRLLDKNGIVRNTSMLCGLQLSGILCLGIIPYFILHHSLPDTILGRRVPGILQLSALVILIVASVTFSEAEANTKLKRVILYVNPAKVFNRSFVSRYFIYRILFLFCYELFFRGYLLTDSMQHFGVLTAIALNVGLYAALHLFNDTSEIIACIPFGIILCSLCIWTGAAWPAVVIHTVFTITYEFKLVKKISGTIKKTFYESICYRLFGLYR